jgi:UDP-GlcNAc:undecaprenyl-phosphate/decaprenyl-phosphate GlcNAc-1-phosphate transferase
VAFAAAFVVTLVATPVAQRVAIRLGLLDHPAVADHKSHDSPIPYLGGAAILVTFLAGAAAAKAFGGTLPGLRAILIAATGLSIVGLIDDHRTLGPAPKLAAQLAAAGVLWWAGTRVLLTGVWWIDLMITVVWVVGISNAFNLLDNMDGLSAGVAAIASAFFWLLAALNGQYLVGSLAAVLCGACLAFLIFNFEPASIYMGDAGSLFLGFVLAVIGIRLRFPHNVNTITWGVPILVLGYPIFDTVLVMVSRRMHGLPIYAGGRDHSSHRLVKVGLPKRLAVLALYLVGVGLGFMALVLSQASPMQALGVLGLAGVLAAVGLVVLLRIDVYGPRPAAPEAEPTARLPLEGLDGVDDLEGLDGADDRVDDAVEMLLQPEPEREPDEAV